MSSPAAGIVWVRNKRTGHTFSLRVGAEHTAYVLSQPDEYERIADPTAVDVPPVSGVITDASPAPGSIGPSEPNKRKRAKGA